MVMRILSSRVTFGLIAGVCALAAAACASTAPRAELSGTRWTATSIAGAPVAGTAPTIEFTQDRIAGTASCNRYFGAYAAAGGDLTVSGVGATRMACEDALMRQEAAYLSVLNSVSGYTQSEGTLSLRASDGRTLEFRRD